MKKLVFDLETDGLLEEVTKVHVLVIRDLTTGERFSCTDSAPGYMSLADGLRLLATGDVLYGHNILTFDLEVLKKLYPEWKTTATIRDTLIAVASLYPHIKDWDYKNVAYPRKLIGRHSLKAWGVRLGNKKIDYTEWCEKNGIKDPWAHWRPEMQTYCEQDVEVNVTLIRYLAKHGVPQEAIETETGVRQFLFDMERNGWPIDEEKAIALQAKLAARRHALTEELKTVFDPWEVSLGMWTPKRDNKKLGYTAGVPVEKKKTVTFNPGSRQQIANRLQTLYGWKPEEYTESGEVKVDETTLKGLDYPPVKLLIEYLTVDKRLGQLAEGKEAWLKYMKPHPVTGLPHIHGRVNQNGTITHRASHSKPNTGQVPAVKSPYGAECREIWMVPKTGGWVQVGADASGLEARCLGHFVARYDGGAYAKLLLEGDVHTANRIAFGLPDAPGMRDRSKTGYYAWMFGAGPEKLGKILDPNGKPSTWKKLGKLKTELFLNATPALKYLIDAVQSKVKRPGYIIGLDGRRVYLRSEHAALNTLIQSSGAIICKRWVYLINKRMRERYGDPSWTGQWTPLGWIHDEVQMAVRAEIAADVQRLCIEAIEELTSHFKFRCSLSGEAKLGANWKETH